MILKIAPKISQTYGLNHSLADIYFFTEYYKFHSKWLHIIINMLLNPKHYRFYAFYSIQPLIFWNQQNVSNHLRLCFIQLSALSLSIFSRQGSFFGYWLLIQQFSQRVIFYLNTISFHLSPHFSCMYMNWNF